MPAYKRRCLRIIEDRTQMAKRHSQKKSTEHGKIRAKTYPETNKTIRAIQKTRYFVRIHAIRKHMYELEKIAPVSSTAMVKTNKKHYFCNAPQKMTGHTGR